MKYRVQGELLLTYAIDVDVMVEAPTEHEAMMEAIVDLGPSDSVDSSSEWESGPQITQAGESNG